MMGKHHDLPKTRADAMIVGSKIYFTGVACKHGHVALRRTDGRMCVECHRAVVMAGYAGAPEKERARRKAWLAANPDKKRASDAAYRAANTEKVRTKSRAWAAANPERVAERWRNYRARKRGADGKYTAEDAVAIRTAQNDKCAYCKVKLKGKGHLDHITPLARGGSNWPRNLQFLCEPCNLSKSATDPVEFAQRKGRLL